MGILVDSRRRYSLTQLQIVLWTIVILSLISGVFWARLIDGSARTALDFAIPSELLVIMGISVGSTVAAVTVKASKDHLRGPNIAATPVGTAPSFMQVFTVEEGAGADQTIDVTKLQNFWITLLLVTAYVALCIGQFNDLTKISDLTTLPSLSSDFIALLAISHGAYLAGKLPNRNGSPAAATAEPLT
jgi:hypothetical protein